MLPGPPPTPKASDVGADSLTLSWGPPAMADALGVTGYRIFSQVGGMHGFAEHAVTVDARCACRVQGLTPSAWHEFKVAAVTALGVGAQSGSSLPVQTQPGAAGAAGSSSTDGREGRRHMAREYKRLKRRLKDWEVEFEQAHGRPPTADDRALDRPILELHRRAQAVKTQLVVTIKDHMEGAADAATRASGSGAAAPPASGRVDEATGLLMPTQQEVAAIEMLFHDFDVRAPAHAVSRLLVCDWPCGGAHMPRVCVRVCVRLRLCRCRATASSPSTSFSW